MEEINTSNFFFFNNSYIQTKTWEKLPKASKSIFPVIMSFANINSEAYPSIKTISKLSGRTEKTVRVGIRGLEEFSILETKKNKTKFGNVSNFYKLETLRKQLIRGEAFKFYKSIIFSKIWSKLSLTSQSLYPVLRFSGFFNKKLFKRFQKEYLGNIRYFDLSQATLSSLSEYSGISKRTVRKAINELITYGLIEEINTNNFKGWIVFYHPFHIIEKNFTKVAISSNIKESREDLIKLLNSILKESSKNIYTLETIEFLFDKYRKVLNKAQIINLKYFEDFLLKNCILKKIEISQINLPSILYVYNDPSIFKLSNMLHNNSYITHYSAMFLHGLTEQIPNSIYVNSEQNKKRPFNSILKQESIDNAFKNDARITKSIAFYKNYKIHFLYGRFTQKLGVIDTSIKKNENISVTNLERTLIDIAIKPAYSGGIYEVLKAYDLASEEVSINKLTAILKKLDYIYPYHQVIGFYLEKTGKYRESQINLLKEIPIKYKFYLTHGMKEMEFSEKWQLYYPKGF